MKQFISEKSGWNMKATYRVALMAVAVVFLLPLSASSETKEGSVELGLFGGYHMFDNNQNLDNSPVFGGLVAYNITNHFGIESSMKVVNSNVDDKTITGGVEGQFTSPTDSVRASFYSIDGVFHFRPVMRQGNFDPFITAGVGVVRFSPSISTKDMGAFNVGVGTKYWIRDNIALRFDLRDNMVTEFFQETFHNFEATVGVTVAIGGKKKPAPVVRKVEPKPEPVIEKQSISEIPSQKPVEAVVIHVSEPEVEKKVAVVVAEPEIEKKVIVLVLEDINFDFDKSTLTPEAQAILKRNIKILNENPRAKVRIAGYTSASGTDEYNQKLSEQRAASVKDYLVNEGLISGERLTTIGYGEDNPETYEVAPKDLNSEAAKSNMRVLFAIVVK